MGFISTVLIKYIEQGLSSFCALYCLSVQSVLSTDISTANLSGDLRLEVPWHKTSTIAVCVHGGELTLWRLWGSVTVMLEFDKTEVQSYEAER